MRLIEVDHDTLTRVLERLSELRSTAGPWPEGPPGYKLATLAGGVYVGFAEADNTDNFLTAVYVVGRDGADDEAVFVVTPDLLAVVEWIRGDWEAVLLGGPH